MSRNLRFPTLLGILFAGGLGLAAAASPDHAAPVHERKEVAGLAVVFGAEPEPALVDEMQFLRWRVSVLADETPYTEMREAQVLVKKDGREFGPFDLQAVRQTPGLYQTRHIFTVSGEYESTLSFRKGEAPEVHSVDFAFRIAERASLELPPRRPGSR